MSHHLVKIKWSDKFVGSDLADCPRDEAPLESVEDAIARAEHRFGKDWRRKAEVIEATQADWMSFIARQPREMTRKRKLHLKRLHASRFPLKRWKWIEGEKTYYVYARAAQKAEELLKQANVHVNWRTFMRRAQSLVHFPFPADKPGVWIRNGKGWRKIV